MILCALGSTLVISRMNLVLDCIGISKQISLMC